MVRFKGSNLVLTVVWLLSCWIQYGVTCPDVCSCPNLLYVYCDHANLSDADLPLVLSKIPTETTYIDLSFNDLTTLPENAFTPFKDIIYLDASHNEIINLSKNVFQSLNNLQKIFLHDNQIKVLRNRTFAELPNLKEVDLNNNEISAIEACAFSSTPKLEKLVLTHNLLTNITRSALLSLTTLTFLDVSHNKIHAISNSAFSILVNLRTLHMGHNEVNSIRAETFSGLISLEHLNMNGNSVVTLDRYSLEPFRETLKKVNFSRNKIRTIQSDVFRGSKILREIDLSFNEISSIGSGAFAGLSLDRLELQGNRLMEVSSAMLSSCYKIGHLDLSDNDIVTVNTRAFESFKEAIYDLDLRFNSLSRILVGMFHGLKFLQTLNLANNTISFIEDYAFKDLTDLKSLDLSWNRLTVVTSAMFEGMQELKHLHLNYNPLMRFEYPEISGKLTNLNIDMNLTVTDVTDSSAVIRWPYKGGPQIYWSRFVTCVKTVNCEFRPQPEFLAPYETDLKLTQLESDSVYYVCINPAFVSDTLRIRQCLFVRTNIITVITTLPLQTPIENPVSSAMAFKNCAIVNFCVNIVITVVNLSVLKFVILL